MKTKQKLHLKDKEDETTVHQEVPGEKQEGAVADDNDHPTVADRGVAQAGIVGNKKKNQVVFYIHFLFL